MFNRPTIKRKDNDNGKLEAFAEVGFGPNANHPPLYFAVGA